VQNASPNSISHITSNPLKCRGNYSATSNGTLAVDGWAVTFGTARRGRRQAMWCWSGGRGISM